LLFFFAVLLPFMVNKRLSLGREDAVEQLRRIAARNVCDPLHLGV